MPRNKKKKIKLNAITEVEITEIDIVVTQEDSMVIIDHDEILKICDLILSTQKVIN
jgi:hypothetical protein